MILLGFLQRLGLVLVRLHGLVIRFLRLIGGSLQIPGLPRGLLGFLSGLPRGLLGGGQRLGRIGSILRGLLALGQCGLPVRVRVGQRITPCGQIVQIRVHVHDTPRLVGGRVLERLPVRGPEAERPVLADRETGDRVPLFDDVQIMAGIAHRVPVLVLAVEHAVGHVLLVVGLFRRVPAVERVLVSPGHVLADVELAGMADVVVGPVDVRHAHRHERVRHLQRGQSLLGAKLVRLLDVRERGDHVVEAGRIALRPVLDAGQVERGIRVGEHLDRVGRVPVAEVGDRTLRELRLRVRRDLLQPVGLGLRLFGGLPFRRGVGRGVGHRLVGILPRLFSLLLGGGGIGCGLLRRFELRGQVGKTSIILGQLLDLGVGLPLGFKRLGLGLPGRIQLGLRGVHRLVGLRLVASRRSLLPPGFRQLLLGGGLVARGLLRVLIGPVGLLLRIADGGIRGIGFLLRVRGLLVGRINIGLGLVGVLLMGGGFGGGFILRGLCGLLVGFCLRLVVGGLLHGLVGVIDGVGRVVRGLLGGGDLVGRAGRILCGLLLGLAGVVVVRLRLLLVVCGCLLLGGGVVEVLLGGV